MTKRKELLLVIFLTAIGGILHFYNLLWGSPFFFHPDERNIASAITQLSFPSQLNPHFFAYGSFPIYLAFLLAEVINHFQTNYVQFDQAIFALRLISASLATLLIPSLYIIGKRLGGIFGGLVASVLITCSSGIIQFAHFGTTEMLQTFLCLWIFYFAVRLLQEITISRIISVGILTGLAIGSKISLLAFIPIPLIAIMTHISFLHPKKFLTILQACFIYIFSATIIYSMTNPFVFITPNEFFNSMHYESSVALGTLPVFYTGEFVMTPPLVYQFFNVYPFLVNPFTTVGFVFSFFFLLGISIKNYNKKYILLLCSYLLLFLSQTFFFVKWIRYMVPTLPYMYLMFALGLAYIPTKIRTYITALFIVIASICSLSFFITAYVQADSREVAAVWAEKHIPTNQQIISEVYDLGIVPFNGRFPYITLVNTYDIDNGVAAEELYTAIQRATYIILPSQRVLQSRTLHPNSFPQGYMFYKKLFDGSLGFKNIYQTPCDMLCKIAYAGNPTFSQEQTASVFDRPIVYIFKRK